MNEKEKNKSEVIGDGWGSCHTWYLFKFTENESHLLPYSTWKCRKCYAVFNHLYNYIPNIFTAMEACKVPSICSRAGDNRPLNQKITGVLMADKEK